MWLVFADFAFKDPDSVRVGAIERGRLGVMNIGGARIATRAYSMQVNARNSYGGYTGEKLFICHLDPSERAVLKINAF